MSSPTPSFEITDACRAAYPGAQAGILAMRGVANPAAHTELAERKRELEEALRARYADADRAALNALPVIQAYRDYYRPFGQSYHVQRQLESLVFKGKSLPNVAALVEAMFMAEVENLLLTAGHDLDALQLPMTLDVAQGDETYTRLQGDEKTLKAGDMYMRDGKGVISSILYGPDRRTRITTDTTRALFAVYAPAGIPAEAVQAHLEGIRDNVKVVSPDAEVEILEVFG